MDNLQQRHSEHSDSLNEGGTNKERAAAETAAIAGECAAIEEAAATEGCAVIKEVAAAEECATFKGKARAERTVANKRGTKYKKRSAVVAALLVALALPCTAIPVGLYAEEAAQENGSLAGSQTESTTQVADVSGSAEKQEVVYATLNASGATQSVYVVNVLQGNPGDVVQDFGTYDAVVNLTDTSELAQTSDSVLFTMPEDGFTYQGNVPSTAIPWNVGITYYLDGQEISAQDLAGKSGHLELRITTVQNTSVDAHYFENYLMQATCTLAMDKARNVQTDDGSIALSGSNITVSFMMMPDSEGSVSLSADVTNFEMDSISFAAIPFSMAIEFPDTDSLVSSFDALIEGTEDLHSGAQDLASGVGSIDDATKQAASGALDLATGATQMAQGLQQYQQGLRDSADQAAGSIDQSQIDAATSAYRSALGNYAAVFATAYEQLKEANKDNPDYTDQQALADAAVQLNGSAEEEALASAMQTLIQLTSTSIASQGAAEALNQAADGLGSTSDVSSLLGGMSSLESGSWDLANGLDQLAGGTGELSAGVSSLTDGTATLAQETQGIPDAVNAEIEALMATYDKSDFEPASFTSSKNTNVTLVQFVLSSDPIKVDEPEPVEEPEQEETIVDRFFALFS